MRHKLQFLVNDHVIPYNMTVYQAIRQFAMAPAGAGGVLPGGGLQVSELCLPSSLFFPPFSSFFCHSNHLRVVFTSSN